LRCRTGSPTLSAYREKSKAIAVAKEATEQEPKHVVRNEPIGDRSNDANLTAAILDTEHSWHAFALVICGTILVLGTIPLVIAAIMQRSIVLATLALASLVVGFLMRRHGKA
jgi:hypothetical protein